MYTIEAGNVNEAYPMALSLLNTVGRIDRSRNGNVLKFPGPLITSYERPQERVLFDHQRDANPFLHLFEAIWMLSGSNDVQWIGRFGPNLLNYSDDGLTLHGAYGHRWKNHFKLDQIEEAIGEILRDHRTRRVVIGMWDPYIDPQVAGAGGKDVPCNTQLFFNVRPDGTLSMTVTNRSNDLVWGLYGANTVHMSILQEYIALATMIPVGTMYTLSNDAHVYEPHFPLVNNVETPILDPYEEEDLSFLPLWDPLRGEHRTQFDSDVRKFMDDPFRMFNDYDTLFFKGVVQPMAKTWEMNKSKFYTSANQQSDQIEAEDWRKAVKEWLDRRAVKRGT
jgi:thymidylate synthase